MSSTIPHDRTELRTLVFKINDEVVFEKELSSFSPGISALFVGTGETVVPCSGVGGTPSAPHNKGACSCKSKYT